ncbi:MAG: DEAD/DEAH box helicase [Flavobacteriaceae bacterium]|jgi:ATP-dependent RNA helicase RhlE|nr:DEAD/DEAH box helicase [Flavobacteriaceae bacterium]MDG1969161.1 DEAD/DEAH box helicase [Flavobacteriaceae bacterium]
MRGKTRKDHPPRKKNKSKNSWTKKSDNQDNNSTPSAKQKDPGSSQKRNAKGGDRNTSRDRSKSNNSKRNSRGGGKSGGRFKKSDLDPQMMVNKTIKLEEQKKAISTREFSALEIHPELQSRISKKGFVKTTEIQDKTFEIISRGDNIIGIANTGTGKTGAFLIPIIDLLLTNKKRHKTIVLVPTRELAQQVDQELRSLSKGLKIYSSCFIGGTSINKDVDKLRRLNHVIIGTPGRINDMINRRALKLHDFDKVVLDEFDTMLDMGFLQEVKKIIDQMHQRNQTILFSATENPKQKTIIDGLIDGYERVRVSEGKANTDNIYQDVIKTKDDEEKNQMLIDLLRKKEFKKVLIFSETKRQVSKLCRVLKKFEVKVDEIHGDKSQQYRSKAIQKFKSGSIQVMVATDVASRGIDIDNITHVINYRIPSSKESYIHRIGRTGRAGKEGSAITFV